MRRRRANSNVRGSQDASEDEFRSLYGPYPALCGELHRSGALPWPRSAASDWNERWQQGWDQPVDGAKSAACRINRARCTAVEFTQHASTVVQQLVDDAAVVARSRHDLGSSASASVLYSQGLVCTALQPGDTRASRELRVLSEVMASLMLRKEAVLSVPLCCIVEYRGLRFWCHAPITWGVPLPAAPAAVEFLHRPSDATAGRTSWHSSSSMGRLRMSPPAASSEGSPVHLRRDDDVLCATESGDQRYCPGSTIGSALARVSERLGCAGDLLPQADGRLYAPQPCRVVWCRGDNRTYVLDVRRWCPDDGSGGAFRPELLHATARPGFTGVLFYGGVQREPPPPPPDQEQQAVNLAQAQVKVLPELQTRLRERQVQTAARQLLSSRVRDAADVKSVLHREGVPLRLLGSVLVAIRGCGRGPAALSAENAVAEEMTARAFRCILRRVLPAAAGGMHQNGGRQAAADGDSAEVMLQHLRLLLDSTPDAERWWTDVMVPLLREKFGRAPQRPPLTHHTAAVVPASLRRAEWAPSAVGDSVDRRLLSRLVRAGRLCMPLLRRVLQLCGVQLAAAAARDRVEVSFTPMTKGMGVPNPEWLLAIGRADHSEVERLARQPAKDVEDAFKGRAYDPFSVAFLWEEVALSRQWTGRHRSAQSAADRVVSERRSQLNRRRDVESQLLLSEALQLAHECGAAALTEQQGSANETEAELLQQVETYGQASVDGATAATQSGPAHAQGSLVAPLIALSSSSWRPFPVRYRMLELAAQQADRAGARMLPALLFQMAEWQQRMAEEIKCQRCKTRRAVRWCDTCEEEGRSEGSGTTVAAWGQQPPASIAGDGSTVAPSEAGEKLEGAAGVFVRRRPGPRVTNQARPKQRKGRRARKAAATEKAAGQADAEGPSLLYGATATLPWHPSGRRTAVLCGQCHMSAHHHPDMPSREACHDTQPIHGDALALYSRCLVMLQTSQFSVPPSSALPHRSALRHADLAADIQSFAGALQGLQRAVGSDSEEVLRWKLRQVRLWGQLCGSDPSLQVRARSICIDAIVCFVRAARAADVRADKAAASADTDDRAPTGGDDSDERRSSAVSAITDGGVVKPEGDGDDGLPTAGWCVSSVTEVAGHVWKLAELLGASVQLTARRRLLVAAAAALGCPVAGAEEEDAFVLDDPLPIPAPPEPPGPAFLPVQQQALLQISALYCEVFTDSQQSCRDVLHVAGDAAAAATLCAVRRGFSHSQCCEVARPLSAVVLRELRISPHANDRAKAAELFRCVAAAFAQAGLAEWDEGAEPAVIRRPRQQGRQQGRQGQQQASDPGDEIKRTLTDMKKVLARLRRHSQPPYGCDPGDLYCHRLLEKADRIRRQCIKASRATTEVVVLADARRLLRMHDKAIGRVPKRSELALGPVEAAEQPEADADGLRDEATPAPPRHPRGALTARVGCSPSAVHPRIRPAAKPKERQRERQVGSPLHARHRVLNVPTLHPDGSVTVLKSADVVHSGLWLHRD